MKERSERTLVHLRDLPIWDRAPFEKLGREYRSLRDYLAAKKLSEPQAHDDAAVRLVASGVEDGLERLYGMALQGNAEAALALVLRVERGVVLLKEAASKRPEIFRDIAHGQSCWPILYSDHPEEREQFAALIQRLEVGKTAEINTMKPPGKDSARTRRWSQKEDATRVVVQLIGQIGFMQPWAELLKPLLDDGDGTAKEILEHVRGELPAYAGKTLLECADLGDLRPHSIGRYVEVIWKMLCHACAGHPERVVEFRKLAVRGAQRNWHSFDLYRVRNNMKTTAEVLARLRVAVGGGNGPTLERAIRTELKKIIRIRLESMVNPAQS
ncbi:MAG TPA: hypothetical protein PLU30_11315 [Verrucomicrobiae bacterium]|nr:hypothetical protein [Verrucomicrobiae bacterium]